MAKTNPKRWPSLAIAPQNNLIQKAIAPRPEYMPMAVPGPAYDNMMWLMIITSRQNAWHVHSQTILIENPINLN